MIACCTTHTSVFCLFIVLACRTAPPLLAAPPLAHGVLTGLTLVADRLAYFKVF
jgi:hypothetical protein